MTSEIEISQLDLRYEDYRIKHSPLEGKLLSSIAEMGIEEPLKGVSLASGHVLLDGFKRCRCARKLRITTVPYTSLGEDEIAGILQLLRPNRAKSLHILEEARFVDELAKGHGLSVTEIAAELSRSKGWVSMRLGLIGEVSPAISKELFAGAFPAYAYMSIVRPFMRMNVAKRKDADAFVQALGGKNLSTREIDCLAGGFFRGPESFREEILKGNLALTLEQIQEATQVVAADPGVCSKFECQLLKDLERTGYLMQRIMGKSHDPQIKSRTFHAQAHLLTTGILSRAKAFTQSIQQLHDRSGQA